MGAGGRSAFELVIFDCDGVLVDSEPISNDVLSAMLNELGLAFSIEEVCERFMGRSMQHCLQTLEQLLGAAPPASFAADYHRRTAAAFELQLMEVAGIRAVLDTLDIPCCVASSGDHAKMRTTLGRVGLLPRFEGRLFSVTEVAHGKPAPDVFLHAAQRCGARSTACLVVEDSPAGVVGGTAAGMTVFGFAARTQQQLLLQAGAHCIFTDMSQLGALIALGPRVT